MPFEGLISRNADGTAILVVQESVYTIDALFKACYLFTDRCYLFLRRAAPGTIEIHITTKDKTSVDSLVGDFCNELIDHRVRADIARESGKIREMIVAQAFAEGGLLDAIDPAEERIDDYNVDPLCISDSSDSRRTESDSSR